MRPFAAPILVAALTLAGCAATPAQEARMAERQADNAERLNEALAGFTAGDPQTCLPVNPTRGTRYFGDTILYDVGGNLIYRTDTNGGCNLKPDDILITQSPLGRSCRGDIARTVDRASRFQTGSCAFGDFVPYRKDRS